MSWQHPREGHEPAIPEVVYDPQQAVGAYDGYADPAVVHGWQESATEAPAAVLGTEPLAALSEEPDGNAVFVDGSGRRGRLMRRGGIALGAACVVFLGVIVTGLFGSSPSGGPLPWSDDSGNGKQPRAEHSGAPAVSPDPVPTGDRTSAASPSATTSAHPSASAGKDTRPAGSPSKAATTAPTTTAPAATASARGNSDTHPGRGNGAGVTKGPK
ncbi:hypothetical protein V2W30_25130 [Streptomyces sp. Q6]|uniref:Uncharacterized protein n=1 Tax=Streptomyces citrinus TaxID=3118173 RepID=A0ACD5AGS6_9ACTN